MRVQPDRITAPPFPRPAGWLNAAMVRLDQQIGRPVLISFFDLASAASVRELPYLAEWDRLYSKKPDGSYGLRIVSVHLPGFDALRQPDAVKKGCELHGVSWPVLLDPEGAYAAEFEIPLIPARYLFDGEGKLVQYSHGEGEYLETEETIIELLGLTDAKPISPLRPVDDDDAALVVPTPDQNGLWSGNYLAGEVWGIFEPPADGSGSVAVNGQELKIPTAGAHLLIDHGVSSHGELELQLSEGTQCHGISFAPGLAESS